MATNSKSKTGFCPTCHKNVPHKRWIGNKVLGALDSLSLQMLGVLRIGPWYCDHCDHRASFLPFPNSKAPDYRTSGLESELPSEAAGEWLRNQNPKSADKSDSKERESEAPAVPIGNFIKSEKSLVMKSNRLQRFSEKYRDAVIRRIFTGATTIAQVREDKQLSEGEITDWLADLFERQQKKIDALELAGSNEQRGLGDRDTVESSMDESNSFPAPTQPR